MSIRIGIGIDVFRGGGAVNPFAGSYQWWLDPVNAITSGGFVDSIPLTGIADSFSQPTAANRPIYNASDLDGKPTIQNDGGNKKIFKNTDSSIFNGNVGTFSFLGKLVSGVTFFVENTGGTFNIQLYTASGTNLRIYTNTDGVKVLNAAFVGNTWAVHTLVLTGEEMKYYRNKILIATHTINQNFNTNRPFCLFGYKTTTSEEGIGSIADCIRTADAKTLAEIEANYDSFWKVKYPSLP